MTASKEIRTTSSTGGQKGVKEQRYDLIPVGPLAQLAVLFGRGARKYEDHNWRRGYEWSKSYAAIQRHMNAFWGGEDMDACNPEVCPEECLEHTNVPHVINAAWHALTLAEFMKTQPDFDDRWKQEIFGTHPEPERCDKKCPQGEHDEDDVLSQCIFPVFPKHVAHTTQDARCTWTTS